MPTLLPAEEILRVEEGADATGLARLLIHFLIANPGRGFQIDDERLRQLGDHAGLGLAAFASIVFVMRTHEPSAEDVAELMIELRERGFHLRHREAAALDTRLVSENQNEVVA